MKGRKKKREDRALRWINYAVSGQEGNGVWGGGGGGGGDGEREGGREGERNVNR
jgi:hypothetical protein